MKQFLSEDEKAAIWGHVRAGVSFRVIGRKLGRAHATVREYVAASGGVRPARRCRARGQLSADEREEISRGLAAGESLRSIATRLKRAPSTVSREVARNGGRRHYRAGRAELAAWERACRPKTSKLAGKPRLRRLVEDKLELEWSPEQIAWWLRQEFPDEPEMWVSHETIYLSLFVQARGALRKQLTAHLRSGRTIRRSRVHTARAMAEVRSSVRWASVNDRRKRTTGPCPATGKATYSSAAAIPRSPHSWNARPDS